MGNKLIPVIFSICFLLSIQPETYCEESLSFREQVILKSGTSQVSVDIAGGSIIEFRLDKSKLNPLTWNYPEKGKTDPMTIGHFVCFDRWGNPSPAELKNGMPFHGEATSVNWNVLSKTSKKEVQFIAVEMECVLPMAGMKLSRKMELSDKAPVLSVSETFTNLNKLGRVCNIVQHPSIAPPFLDENTIVDTNAWKGIVISGKSAGEQFIYWPKIVYNNKPVDLRTLISNDEPGVTGFVFADSLGYGWVTACNPAKGLLIGYIWKLSDYPWVDIWRQIVDGKPFARGLEFGTTSMSGSFENIIKKGTILDKPLYLYLDAGQNIEKSYTAFLSEIPADYKGVGDVVFSEENIIVKEMGTNGRQKVISY